MLMPDRNNCSLIRLAMLESPVLVRSVGACCTAGADTIRPLLNWLSHDHPAIADLVSVDGW